MTPAGWIVTMLAVTALIYVITAVAYQTGARPGMALAFAGYALANLGFIWDAIGGGK